MDFFIIFRYISSFPKRFNFNFKRDYSIIFLNNVKPFLFFAQRNIIVLFDVTLEKDYTSLIFLVLLIFSTKIIYGNLLSFDGKVIFEKRKGKG